MDEKTKKIVNDAEQRDYIYVYFIENHIATSKVSLEMRPFDYEEAGNLECVKQKYFNQNNIKFIYSIFRFRIFSPKIKENRIKNKNTNLFNIDIILIDEKKGEFKKKI